MDIFQTLEEIHGQDPKLKPFFNFAAKLPPSFELVSVRITRASPEEVKRKRRKFGQPSKIKNRYQYFARNYERELLDMGVSMSELDNMLYKGIRPKTRDGGIFDISFDHMHSIFLGGDSLRESNLCLVPHIFNSFKDRLERLQLGSFPEKDSLFTIMPIYNKRTNRRWGVPIIEGGFPERISNRGIKNEPHI
ncbi:MAG: hypothetical protein AAF244_02900 [Pseudomonadota bacterium]